MSEKLNSVYLDHSVDAVQDTAEFISGLTLEAFRQNKLVRFATVRALLIVGEYRYPRPIRGNPMATHGDHVGPIGPQLRHDFLGNRLERRFQ